MAGITRPSHLLPSAHARPKPHIGDFPILDNYVDGSDSEIGCAEAGGSARGEGGCDQSPSPSEDAAAGHPKALCKTAWKHRASSQPGEAR